MVNTATCCARGVNPNGLLVPVSVRKIRPNSASQSKILARDAWDASDAATIAQEGGGGLLASMYLAGAIRPFGHFSRVLDLLGFQFPASWYLSVYSDTGISLTERLNCIWIRSSTTSWKLTSTRIFHRHARFEMRIAHDFCNQADPSSD